MAAQVLEVPMCLPSRANLEHTHWHRAKLVKQQHAKLTLALRVVSKPKLPVTVHLVRISPRSLDDDNLRGAFKAVRDCLATWMGLEDDKGPEARWLYDQARDPQKRTGYQAIRLAIVEGQFDCPVCGSALPSDPLDDICRDG